MINKLTLLAAAAAVLGSVPAFAESPLEVVVETKISYADLNLSSAAGRATLDNRIKGAARFVCGPNQGPTLAEHKHRRDCQSNAIQGAHAQVERALASRGAGTVLAARR